LWQYIFICFKTINYNISFCIKCENFYTMPKDENENYDLSNSKYFQVSTINVFWIISKQQRLVKDKLLRYVWICNDTKIWISIDHKKCFYDFLLHFFKIFNKHIYL